jgi:hypothetical protein
MRRAHHTLVPVLFSLFVFGPACGSKPDVDTGSADGTWVVTGMTGSGTADIGSYALQATGTASTYQVEIDASASFDGGVFAAIALTADLPSGSGMAVPLSNLGVTLCDMSDTSDGGSACDSAPEGTVTYTLADPVDCSGGSGEAAKCLTQLQADFTITKSTVYTGTLSLTIERSYDSGGGSGCDTHFPSFQLD